jgi:beta-lactamase class A
MICRNFPRLVAALLFVALAVGPVSAARAGTTPTLPLSATTSAWRPLDQCWNRALQTKLDQALHGHKFWRQLISQGKLAVGLVDLTDPLRPRFAQVNGNTMMYAASLPKIAVLLAAFQGFADGSLQETPQIRADLIEMIRRSDNYAASQVIARISLRKIEGLILAPRYRFYDANTGGGLWVGTSFVRGGEENPEPLKNLGQAATVYQVCRFYYLLAYGRLINPERSRQMLKILAFPDLHDKFVSSLEGTVPLSHLYRKSGEFRIWHSDSILVWGKAWRRYILVALVEDRQGEQILRHLVPLAEGILRPRRP